MNTMNLVMLATTRRSRRPLHGPPPQPAEPGRLGRQVRRTQAGCEERSLKSKVRGQKLDALSGCAIVKRAHRSLMRRRLVSES